MYIHFPGTYALQDVVVVPLMLSGTVDIHLHYAENSTVRGCLLIFHQAQYTGYFALEKPLHRERQNAQLEGLPAGEYTVRAYELGTGGQNISLHTLAVTLNNVTVEHGAAFWNNGS